MNVQSSFYRSVNGIERAPRSNLARLPAISAVSGLHLWGFTLPKESHALFHEGHSTVQTVYNVISPVLSAQAVIPISYGSSYQAIP